MYKYNNYMHPVVPLGSIAATSGWNPLKCLFFKCSFVVIYCSKWHNWGFCCKLNTWNLLFFVFPTRLYELPIFAQSNNFMWFLVSDGAYGALLSSDGTNEWQSFELVVISGCQIIICVRSWQKKVKLPHKSLGLLQGVVCGSAAEAVQWVYWAAPGRLAE